MKNKKKMPKKELSKTDEMKLTFLYNIRKLLNSIEKGKFLNNSHIKEIWNQLDLLEDEIIK
jgi:hypothetical protein